MVLSFMSRSSEKAVKPDAQPDVKADDVAGEPTPAETPSTPTEQPPAETRPSASIYSSDAPEGHTIEVSPAQESNALIVPPSNALTPESSIELNPSPAGQPRARRFSWRSISFLSGNTPEEHKHALPAQKEQKLKAQAVQDRMRRTMKSTSADRKAKETAVIVRSLIVGSSGGLAVNQAIKSKPVTKAKIIKAKAELLQPKKANRVIAQLRTLPSTSKDYHSETTKVDVERVASTPTPIHAVCLPYSDAEAEALHFAKLTPVKPESTPHVVATDRSLNLEFAMEEVASVYNASISQLKTVLSDMHVVSLITTPDMGLGEPGDGPGLFSGAVPTAETIINGVEQITPELMSLGYATGQAILPDHSHIHPPTDRMSVLTYWWGFEVAMPPPSIEYLSKAPSIAHSAINVLTALAVLNNGVREILPFVRYISSFIDTEFSMIKQQDQGRGVVCAATWLIPAALVPQDPKHSETEHAEPAEPATAGPPEQPVSSPSPSSPAAGAGSKPESPPTLLPPLALHDPAFDAPRSSPPVDDTPSTHISLPAPGAEKDGEIPDVNVVPPTPPASNTLRGVPEAITEAV
ncbi:hypothetical protein EW026_g4056 [Hermanssonia centrifuga]|uniref:Uncharacterized protein n=1 Tax=Hermanssonia centrifuga TaxID=98765 RepID=A0A4V3XAG8_9APHY|nr:hypothetical protein EW026_g4056 [Hermanssonia centrifuga]